MKGLHTLPVISRDLHLERGQCFTKQISVCFLKILKLFTSFHQYQARWYLFECISPGDSKYGNEIQQC